MLASYLEYARTYYVKDAQPTSQLDRVKRSLAPALDLYGAEEAARFGPAALRAAR
jgi:alpha-D-ribose 1-methylphosphonate 5-phosphate C-P lyase